MSRESHILNAPVFKFENSIRDTSFKILVSVLLSSRTKDEKTLNASKNLFSVISTPHELIKLSIKKIEKLIYGVGFYRTKAKNLKLLSKVLINDFNGKVPNDYNSLISLRGVGRKTANIVLSLAFGRFTLGVDTHVHRISNRLGWVKTKTPLETEKELLRIIPKNLIRKFNKILVAYGQTICTPINPKCIDCKLNKICKSSSI